MEKIQKRSRPLRYFHRMMMGMEEEKVIIMLPVVANVPMTEIHF